MRLPVRNGRIASECEPHSNPHVSTTMTLRSVSFSSSILKFRKYCSNHARTLCGPLIVGSFAGMRTTSPAVSDPIDAASPSRMASYRDSCQGSITLPSAVGSSPIGFFYASSAGESIAEAGFSTSVSLSQVYGAIAYYLDHQIELDEYMAQGESTEGHFSRRLPDCFLRVRLSRRVSNRIWKPTQ